MPLQYIRSNKWQRQGRHDDIEDQRRRRAAAAAQHPAEAGHHAPDVAPEIDQHRAEAADMHGDIDDDPETPS